MTRSYDFPNAEQHAFNISESQQTDIFIYNGSIRRLYDIEFMSQISSRKKFDKLLLILVTNGGDPDAAYRMARFIQDTYSHFTIFVTGMCKSAGTLLALGANEIIFSPYGELGPLDMQNAKEDRIGQLQSALIITEALKNLEARATAKYFEVINSIFESSSNISFSSASKSAIDLVHGLYTPIFGQIDPEDIGDKARSMQIATDYGNRLAIHSNNLKENALNAIVRTYSSHSFVIDRLEAALLFNNVKLLNEEQAILMGYLGDCAIMQTPKRSESPVCKMLSYREIQDGEATNENEKRDGNSEGVAEDIGGAVKPTPIRDRKSGAKFTNKENDRVPVAAT